MKKQSKYSEGEHIVYNRFMATLGEKSLVFDTYEQMTDFVKKYESVVGSKIDVKYYKLKIISI